MSIRRRVDCSDAPVTVEWDELTPEERRADQRITALRTALSAVQTLAAQIDELIDDALERDFYTELSPLPRGTRPGFHEAAVSRGEDRSCPACSGRGYLREEDCVFSCSHCAGTGSEASVRPDPMGEVMRAAMRGDHDGAMAALERVPGK